MFSSHPDFYEQVALFGFCIRNCHNIVTHFYQQGVLVNNMDFTKNFQFYNKTYNCINPQVLYKNTKISYTIRNFYV